MVRDHSCLHVYSNGISSRLIVCPKVPLIVYLNPFCENYRYIGQRRGRRGGGGSILQCLRTWERGSERRLSGHTQKRKQRHRASSSGFFHQNICQGNLKINDIRTTLGSAPKMALLGVISGRSLQMYHQNVSRKVEEAYGFCNIVSSL